MNLDIKLKFNFNKRNRYKNIYRQRNNSTGVRKHIQKGKYVKNKHIGNCPDCVFNKYLCYGLLCNIVVLKVVKDEEMRHN